jgi:hypothetical protein
MIEVIRLQLCAIRGASSRRRSKKASFCNFYPLKKITISGKFKNNWPNKKVATFQLPDQFSIIGSDHSSEIFSDIPLNVTLPNEVQTGQLI